VTSGGWVFAGKAIAILAGVAMNVLLARLVSPQEMGTYFIIVSLVTTAALVAQGGLNHAAVRFIAELRGKKELAGAVDVVAKSFYVVTVLSLVTGLGYYFFSKTLAQSLFHMPMIGFGASLMVGWIVLTALRALAAECFRGFEYIRLATLFEGLLTSLVFLLLTAYFYLTTDSITLDIVLWLMLSSAFVSAFSAMLVLYLQVKGFGRRAMVTLKSITNTALPLLANNILFVFVGSFGLWIAGVLGGSDDAALYGAATRLIVLMQFPLLALNAIVPPMVARMNAEGNSESMQNLLRWCATVALLFALPVMLVFLLWGDDLLGLLFGAFYSHAYWVLLLLGVGVMANAWTGYCGTVLMMTGYQSLMLKQAVLTLLVTVPLTWYCGKVFGLEGVAAGISFGILVEHVLWWLSVKKHLGVWTHAGWSLRKQSLA